MEFIPRPGKSVLIRVLRLLTVACLLSSLGWGQSSGTQTSQRPRRFIAHRGVNLHSTIAGENSLEAIGLARRAGFDAVETDVRLTADGQLVVMHDDTLNRTCVKADESPLQEKVAVAAMTFAELRANYVLKADERQSRIRIPTLWEYLGECRKHGLLPFIEPKLYDATGSHYQDIIRLADEVMGRGRYIITSNNKANRVIRDIGLRDVRLMGILYQTTFEEISGLGNVIMAISTSRFSEAEFAAHSARAIAAGLPIESHADDYRRFAVIDAHPVDYVSTDLVAPDLASGAKVVARHHNLADFRSDGNSKGGALSLPAGGAIRLKADLPQIPFGGIYLDLEMKGECTVRLAHQEFTFENSGQKRCRYQLMVYKVAPNFEIVATRPCDIRSINLTLAEF
jgi:glycerophosphoryl diester phosphodiesterase